MPTYSLRDVRSMLGLSRGVVRGLIAAGFVTPGRGPRRAMRFTFRDLVLLRTARELQLGDVPSRRILAALRRLRAKLPEEMPLSALRLTAIGADVVVRDGDAQWHAASGQGLIDFEFVAPGPAAAHVLDADAARAGAAAWFRRGVELERRDPAGAEAAYGRAIAADPADADAVLNLGVLLGEAGRAAEAAALYRRAAERLPGHALLQFNLAVMLEDSGDDTGALAAYDRCLAIDPGFADAHFNAARLHDRLGHATRAIRHYSAYRRLNR